MLVCPTGVLYVLTFHKCIRGARFGSICDSGVLGSMSFQLQTQANHVQTCVASTQHSWSNGGRADFKVPEGHVVSMPLAE